jgi:hypothetical protein
LGLGAGLLTAEPAYAGGVRTLRESDEKRQKNVEKSRKDRENIQTYKII